MTSGVWNYLTGYVIIEVKGMGLERFLNRAAFSCAGLWHIRRTAGDAVTAYASTGAFYALRKLVRGTGLRVHIIEKRGVPIKLYRMRGRLALLICPLIMAALIVIASRFIWKVTVEGCDTVDPQTIVDALQTLGVGVGSKRNAAFTYPLGARLMAGDERIAWAGVRLEGVILRVSIKEADPSAAAQEEKGPASIYAARDGVVTRVVVEGGKAAVNAGQAVVKGQLLISGVLWDDGQTRLTGRAGGEVLADVLYTLEYTAGPELTLPVRTGEAQRGVSISLFGISLGGAGEGFECQSVSRWRLTNCFLPLSVELFDMWRLEEKPTRANAARLEAEARARAGEAALGLVSEDARILSKQTDITMNEDGSVTATVRIVAEENIAELRELDGEGNYGG